MTAWVERVRFRRDHQWVPGHLSAYADGELAAGPRLRVQRHVRDCPECRRLLQGLQRMLGILHRLPEREEEATPDIAAAVRRRLRDQAKE